MKKFVSYLGYVVMAIIYLAFFYYLYWFIDAAIESDWHWTYIENDNHIKQIVLTIWLWLLYIDALAIIAYFILKTKKH